MFNITIDESIENCIKKNYGEIFWTPGSVQNYRSSQLFIDDFEW